MATHIAGMIRVVSEAETFLGPGGTVNALRKAIGPIAPPEGTIWTAAVVHSANPGSLPRRKLRGGGIHWRPAELRRWGGGGGIFQGSSKGHLRRSYPLCRREPGSDPHHGRRQAGVDAGSLRGAD